MNKRKPTPMQSSIVAQHLTIPQVAATLQVGVTTVYKLIKYEGLPTVSIVRGLRVSSTDLETWLKARKRTGIVS